MKTRFSAAALVALLALLSASLPVGAAETKPKAGSDPAAQKAMCDARCRQDYQGNSAAIDACIRNCGAAGPASAGARTATVKSSKSNSSDRAVQGGVKDPTPAEATTIKGSKSNSSDRVTGSSGPAPEPAKASNLNLSKSNINREAAPAGATGPADAAKFHGNTLNQTTFRGASSLTSGVVTNVDAAANTISVRRRDGSVIVMDTSKLGNFAKGVAKVGQSVNVSYTDAGGKPTAQSIAVTDGPPPDKRKPNKN